MTTICVDAMSSDGGPEVVLQGIAQALEEDSNLSVLVAGSSEYVTPFCERHEGAMPLISSEVIHMDEHPATAVRKKKDASIVRAARAVREGKAEGLFSAGSTGAVLTASTFIIGRIRGIKRPAIALPIPGPNGKRTIFLDMGANADVRPDMLVQFAQMGRAYSRIVTGTQNPTVGLLSNGSEDTKGSQLALEYHKALAEADCNFKGNAEGTDLLSGSFDVVVTDGFTGNVALKSVEGTAKFIVGALKDSIEGSPRLALGALMLKPVLKKVASELSGDKYGGAILIGLKAPVLKGHGASSVDAVTAGTLHCAEIVRAHLVDEVSKTIQAHEAQDQ